MFFLSWVANTQFNQWTMWVVRTHSIAKHQRNFPGLSPTCFMADPLVVREGLIRWKDGLHDYMLIHKSHDNDFANQNLLKLTASEPYPVDRTDDWKFQLQSWFVQMKKLARVNTSRVVVPEVHWHKKDTRLKILRVCAHSLRHSHDDRDYMVLSWPPSPI